MKLCSLGIRFKPSESFNLESWTGQASASLRARGRKQRQQPSSGDEVFSFRECSRTRTIYYAEDTNQTFRRFVAQLRTPGHWWWMFAKSSVRIPQFFTVECQRVRRLNRVKTIYYRNRVGKLLYCVPTLTVEYAFGKICSFERGTEQ